MQLMLNDGLTGEKVHDNYTRCVFSLQNVPKMVNNVCTDQKLDDIDSYPRPNGSKTSTPLGKVCTVVRAFRAAAAAVAAF